MRILGIIFIASLFLFASSLQATDKLPLEQIKAALAKRSNRHFFRRTHLSRNYPLVLVGGKKMGFKHGQHLNYAGAGAYRGGWAPGDTFDSTEK